MTRISRPRQTFCYYLGRTRRLAFWALLTWRAPVCVCENKTALHGLIGSQTWRHCTATRTHTHTRMQSRATAESVTFLCLAKSRTRHMLGPILVAEPSEQMADAGLGWGLQPFGFTCLVLVHRFWTSFQFKLKNTFSGGGLGVHVELAISDLQPFPHGDVGLSRNGRITKTLRTTCLAWFLPFSPSCARCSQHA